MMTCPACRLSSAGNNRCNRSPLGPRGFVRVPLDEPRVLRDHVGDAVHHRVGDPELVVDQLARLLLVPEGMNEKLKISTLTF